MGVKTPSRNKQFTIKETIRYRKYYQAFVLGSGAFLIAFVFTSVFTPVQNSDAAQLFSVSNENTGYYVNVSGSAAINISTTTTPDGQLAGATDKITTTTNSPRGYQLYISASPNYLYLNGDPSTSSQGKFSPIGGSLTNSISLGSNTWGFAFNKNNAGVVANNFQDASAYVPEGSASSEDDTIVPSATATYTSLPTTDTKIQEINSANFPNGTELDIYYGVKANTSLPSGNYSGTITYTAISDGVNNNATFMQDFTTAECQALPTATKDNYATAHVDLIDKRDMKWYSVAKLADGNCWMTSNLALDGTDSSGAVRTLTPDDSNVSENRTLAANISGTIEAKYDEIQINSSVAENSTTSCNITAYPYCIESDVKYGNLYNWNAATAGVGTQATIGTVFESICPKGWRLPDNGGEGVDKSWGNLMKKYGYSGTNVTNGAYVQDAQQAPLYLPLAGLSSGSSLDSQGRNAYFWSRTVQPNSNSAALNLALYAKDALFYPQNDSPRYYGMPVRCVFQGDTIQNNMYMQDVTTTMCNNLNESTTTSDNRRTVIDGRDGKSYQISHLADGNCWMVSNLALDGGRDLFPGSSNVTEKRTLPANVAASGVAAEYDVAQINSQVANNTTTTKNYTYAVVSDVKYGNLYNWNAATATVGKKETTGTVTESVCPTGWRLPDNGGEGVDKSWGNLMKKSGYSDTNVTDGASVIAVQGTPFYLPLAGYSAGSSLHNQGRRANFWSRTVYSSDTNNAFHLLLIAENGNFYPQHNTSKSYGSSVRCVLGS